MSYPNGRFPLHLFVHRGGNIYLSPSLNARWNEGVRLALEKYGVRLYITGDIDGLGGWNGYRPFEAQVRYRRHYGIMAAVEGTSSHGGLYQGREVFAADVANWQDLAPGNRTLAWSRFVALMKIVGLTVDFVKPREQWHIGDFNPAWTAPVFGAVAVNPGTTNRPTPVPEEDDMPGPDMKLVAWNNEHYFLIGEESIYHVVNKAWLPYLADHYGPRGTAAPIDNGAFTLELVINRVPWDAVDACMRGAAYGPDKRSWSRLQAEGIAIRGAQATQSKTLADVLATAQAIPKAK